MARAESPDETPTRAERREVYEKLLRIVEYNTGDGGPALAKQTSILITAGHAGLKADRARSIIQAAIDNSDLVRVGDRIARTDDASVQDVLEAEVAKNDPNKQLVGWCNQRLREER